MILGVIIWKGALHGSGRRLIGNIGRVNVQSSPFLIFDESHFEQLCECLLCKGGNMEVIENRASMTLEIVLTLC